ncbi:rod-binding protein [Kineothrix sp. MB12-C1]|uniref:rod-binding protein n=1 Tax=Kineothrix sp. MB12-C1 TaxID=3070215 RepID=UPI0027D2CEA3|nr:rod-binding protein [Kineothrix sp. MB12-C1]WMC91598.1 rod-binding protein [Kineothrix sp. MB12-C1]
MDIGSGVSSAYTSYLSSQASSKLNSRIKTKDYSQSSEDELLAACKEFESYFMEQIYKEMQKTVDVFKEDKTSPNDTLVDFFKDGAIQDLASTSTENEGLGLAQMLYEQMKRNYNL